MERIKVSNKKSKIKNVKKKFDFVIVRDFKVGFKFYRENMINRKLKNFTSECAAVIISE